MQLGPYLVETDELPSHFARRVNSTPGTISKIIAGKLWASRALWRRIREATNGRVTPNDHLDHGQEETADAPA